MEDEEKKLRTWIRYGTPTPGFPTIHVVSDAIGMTGLAFARAIAAAFLNMDPAVEVLGGVKGGAGAVEALEEHLAYHRAKHPDMPFIVLYTFAAGEDVACLDAFNEANPEVTCVNLLAAGVNALRGATGLEPTAPTGTLRAVNEHYYKRIDAIEFTIAHDDGRNPHELTEADIVLIGVSRTSKTPLSIFLSQQGYRVANVPLDPLSEPPQELFDVDRTRLFGLMTAPEILVDIRKRRLGSAGDGAMGVASSYADYEKVCQDLEKARALMRKLGCIVVRTDNRAIEETAQEIMRYYTNMHGFLDFNTISL